MRLHLNKALLMQANPALGAAADVFLQNPDHVLAVMAAGGFEREGSALEHEHMTADGRDAHFL